jgi:hypothetical protein
LEIIEIFFDLSEKCCFCGRPLGYECLRPTVYESQKCNFAFSAIGAGSSLIFEIKKDIGSIDLLLSVYANY